MPLAKWQIIHVRRVRGDAAIPYGIEYELLSGRESILKKAKEDYLLNVDDFADMVFISLKYSDKPDAG